MFGRIDQLLPVVVVVLGVATARADIGYLPMAGPPALRFRVPPPVAQRLPAPVVPPLPAPILLPAPLMPPSPPAQSATNQAAPAKMIKVVAVTNAPALEYDSRDFAPIPAPSNAPDAVISPQMLIKYFTQSAMPATNGVSAGTGVPLGFTPPSVAAPSVKPAPPPPAVVPNPK